MSNSVKYVARTEERTKGNSTANITYESIMGGQFEMFSPSAPDVVALNVVSELPANRVVYNGDTVVYNSDYVVYGV